ncbi:heme-binding protein [Chloroflexota bacterium]
MAIESPRYETVRKDNKFEIREYEEYILAEVEIDGDFGSALQKGFRVLADYIFGGNTSKARINMTVPVTEQAVVSEKVVSEKIEMTAPVTSSPVEEGKKYIIAFTMPSKYTLESLPEPENKTISFRKVGEQKVASLRFSGNLNSKLATRKAKELETWLNGNRYSKKTGFVFAQYNPPWIPGIFRRNEILTEVR